MLSAAAIMTSPMTAPMTVLRALAAREESPADVTNIMPPTMMTIIAATPAIVASTRDTRFNTPLGPEIVSLLVFEQAGELLAAPLQAQDNTFVLFAQLSGPLLAALTLEAAPTVRVTARTTAITRAEK
jgi:hypothetical protein